MPTSARKSSLSAAAVRRGEKAHIPYRGDNPGVGKKTGIPVAAVEAKSDGFEPFDEVIQQADGRTPPQRKRKRKSVAAPAVEEEDDGYGEMSMDVDSPIQQYLSTSRAYTPANVNRVGSSSRPVARSSDVDFDSVPSPRARSAAHRKSLGTPSRLSRSFHIDDDLEDDDDNGHDPDPSFRFDIGGGGMDFGNDDNVSPEHPSFTEMDRDEDEDGGEDDMLPQVNTSSKSKGKAKAAAPPPPREEEEDDVANSLQDLDQEEEETPRAKKPRLSPAEKKQPVPKKSRSKKENQAIYEDPPGVRRSKRAHVKPLDWWRNEKYVYGRPNSGTCLVPHVKEVVRIPQEPAAPLGSKPKKRKPVKVWNPEKGWDKDTPDQHVVLSFPDKREVLRRIAFPSHMIEPMQAANAEWKFQKIFGDDNFIAAGELIIPPQARKPSKMTKDNTYIFFVVEGAVNLKVYNSSIVMCQHSCFMVPRGNTYFIENISDRDAKLFFTQARQTVLGEDDPAGDDQRSSQRRSTSTGGTAVETAPRSKSIAIVPRAGSSKESGGATKRGASAKV